jgi:hypothetical protein
VSKSRMPASHAASTAARAAAAGEGLNRPPMAAPANPSSGDAEPSAANLPPIHQRIPVEAARHPGGGSRRPASLPQQTSDVWIARSWHARRPHHKNPAAIFMIAVDHWLRATGQSTAIMDKGNARGAPPGPAGHRHHGRGKCRGPGAAGAAIMDGSGRIRSRSARLPPSEPNGTGCSGPRARRRKTGLGPRDVAAARVGRGCSHAGRASCGQVSVTRRHLHGNPLSLGQSRTGLPWPSTDSGSIVNGRGHWGVIKTSQPSAAGSKRSM